MYTAFVPDRGREPPANGGPLGQMARAIKDIVLQIIEVRSRRSESLAHSEVYSEAAQIREAYRRLPKDVDERMLRYFPVAIVACIESFYRIAVAQLIDLRDAKILANTEKIAARTKPDFEVLLALGRSEITLGELVAHSIALSNLGQIAGQMSALLDCNYLYDLSLVHDRVAVELKNAPKEPIIRDSDLIYRGVSKAFELRHIICHEVAFNYAFDPAEIHFCVESCLTFLHAASWHLSEKLEPSAPLTQRGLNEWSGKAWLAERSKLEGLNEELLKKLPPERQTEYTAVHDAWSNFCQQSADFAANEYMGGSIMPLVHNMTAQSLTSDRIKQVESLIKAEAQGVR